MRAYHKLAEYYDLIYGKRENFIEDCDFLNGIFKRFCQNKPVEILDIGCGTGNHVLILAERGYKVIGIDQSEKMIQVSKKKAEKKRIDATFYVQDMRYLKIPKKVDCAISMFNGFGYLLTQQDLEQFLTSLHKSLKEDSLFVFEFWNIGGIKSTPYKNWTKRRQNGLLLYRVEKSSFQVETNILQSLKDFIIIQDDKLLDFFEEKHEIKCYTTFELQQLLNANSFELLSVFDFDKRNKMHFKKPERETLRIMAIAKTKG
jgi:SAM-dependent methyltransferase